MTLAQNGDRHPGPLSAAASLPVARCDRAGRSTAPSRARPAGPPCGSHVNGIDLDVAAIERCFAAHASTCAISASAECGDLVRLADHYLWNLWAFPWRPRSQARAADGRRIRTIPSLKIVLLMRRLLPYGIGRLDHATRWPELAAKCRSRPRLSQNIYCNSITTTRGALHS